MERLGVEDPSEVSVVDEPGGGQLPETVPTSRDEPRQEPQELHDQVERVNEPAEPLAEVRRLEVELERYREHAQRTSKLFLSVTKYVEWVRENARRDAELALRKARAKVDKLDRTARELERTERELVRRQDELARLQALTDETRARLSAFLTAGLQALNTEVEPGQEDNPKLALGDLQDTLHRQLASTSASAPEPLGEVKTPER